MAIEQAQYDALSKKAVSVIGRETILAMSEAQRGLLNKELDRMMLRHKGEVDKVTTAEIEGAYELIVVHVLPTGSHEHLLK
jgi:hypothetical protein